MKKLNSKGFILAETLIVCVFLMVMFTMIYTNFYPIIGEYEKRENYDDVDGKYVAYWVKKLVESDSYKLVFDSSIYGEDMVRSSIKRVKSMNQYGYMRFECKDMLTANNQRDICKNLVNSFEISNCDSEGNGCDIFITHYQIGPKTGTTITPNFKNTVKNNEMRRYEEQCLEGQSKDDCRREYFSTCCKNKGLRTCYNVDANTLAESYVNEAEGVYASDENNNIARYCRRMTNSRVFSSAIKDYVLSLPDYTIRHATTEASYRVIVVVHHQKDYNDYYSFSTMEVIK